MLRDLLAKNLLVHPDKFSRFVPLLFKRHLDLFVVTGSTVSLSNGMPSRE